MRAATSTASSSLIALSGSASVKVINGVVTQTGFTSPTIYVDDVAGATALTDSNWHHVVVTTATPINASAVTIGQIGTSFYGGALVDIRMYSKVLAATDVDRLFHLGGTAKINVPVTSNNAMSTSGGGLAGWWTFDGKNMIPTVKDSSGNGNNGDINVSNNVNLSAFATSSKIGVIGQALNFGTTTGGIEDVVVPSTSSIDNLFANGGTISFWLNLRSYGYGTTAGHPAGFTVILDKMGNSLANGWRFVPIGPQRDGTNPGRIVFNAEFTNGGATEGGWTTNPGSLTFNSWHHYVLTYNASSASNVATFYLDGQPNNGGPVQPTGGTYNSDAGNTLVMGDYDPADAPVEPLDGMLDDVRMYKRILSPTEIQRLYQLGAKSSHPVNTSLATSNTLSKSNGGLVGWWTFDGKNMLQNASDSSGQGNNGDLVNFTSTTTAIGKIGQALSFNASQTQYVSVSPSSSLAITGAFTIAGWIYWTGGSFNFNPVYAKWNAAGTIGYGLSINSSGKLRLDSCNTSCSILAGATTITANQWYFVTGTFDASGGVALYVNGALDAGPSSAGGTAPGDNGVSARIGSDSSTAGREWTGKLDDVRIYNRALSPADVQRLYGLGK